MPASSDPNLGLKYGWTLGESGWNVDVDQNFKRLGAVVGLGVKSAQLGVPPASPVDGDRYIIPSGATGEWTGRTNQVAVRVAGAWEYHVPVIGWVSFVEDTSVLSAFKGGTGWSAGVSV